MPITNYSGAGSLLLSAALAVAAVRVEGSAGQMAADHLAILFAPAPFFGADLDFVRPDELPQLLLRVEIAGRSDLGWVFATVHQRGQRCLGSISFLFIFQLWRQA